MGGASPTVKPVLSVLNYSWILTTTSKCDPRAKRILSSAMQLERSFETGLAIGIDENLLSSLETLTLIYKELY